MVNGKVQLEDIAREFNPIHDFDNVRFHNHINTDSLAEKARAQLHNLTFFPTLVKPLARGSIIGGIAGVAGAYLSDNTLYSGFMVGVNIVAYLDVQQYLMRGFYHYLKAQINP
jgi:hypothetical protein